MSSATRLPCLDGVRGIAAIGVMLFHFNRFFPAAKPFFRPRCSLVGNPAAKNLRRSFISHVRNSRMFHPLSLGAPEWQGS